MDDDRIDCSEKKKQLFQLRMYRYMSTLPKRQPADPPLSKRILGVARYYGMSESILSQYAEKEAEMILDHWQGLECEFNGEFYDKNDEREIDVLSPPAAQININKLIVRGLILIFTLLCLVLALERSIR